MMLGNRSFLLSLEVNLCLQHESEFLFTLTHSWTLIDWVEMQCDGCAKCADSLHAKCGVDKIGGGGGVGVYELTSS